MVVKTYLVTGASGFLGYHVCRYLVGRSQKVKGIDIEAFDYPDIADKVTFFKGDIRDCELLEKVIPGTDIIVHSAAALPLWPRKEIFSVNIFEGKALLLGHLEN